MQLVAMNNDLRNDFWVSCCHWTSPYSPWVQVLHNLVLPELKNTERMQILHSDDDQIDRKRLDCFFISFLP